MKKVATVAAALSVFVLSTAPAEAVRPIPGHEYPDLCKNVRGTQTILEIASGYWEFEQKSNGTRFKFKCQPGWRSLVITTPGTRPTPQD